MQAHVANGVIDAHDMAPNCKLVKPQGVLSDEKIEERLIQATELFFDPEKRRMIKKIYEARQAASVAMLNRTTPNSFKICCKIKK